MNIHQVYISRSLGHFSRIKKLYNLSDYVDTDKPLLIFGMYDSKDYHILKTHRHTVYVMWGGSDIDPRIKKSLMIINKINKLFIVKNIIHIAISISIAQRMDEFGMIYKLIDFTLADPKLFFKTGNIHALDIYIYNGFSKGKEWIYGKKYYQKIEKKIPEFKYIHSCDANIPHEKMPQIYSRCFVGLRLTHHDGNANTVQELNMMDIPIIYNGLDTSVKCIRWHKTSDIIKTILDVNTKQFISRLSESNSYILLSLSENMCDTYRHIIVHDWMVDNGYNVKSYSNNKDMICRYSKYPDTFIVEHERFYEIHKTQKIQELYFGVPTSNDEILSNKNPKMLFMENENEIENMDIYSTIYSSNKIHTKKHYGTVRPFHIVYLLLHNKNNIVFSHKKYKYIVVCLKFIPLSLSVKNFIKQNIDNNILLVGDDICDSRYKHKFVHTTDKNQIIHYISKSRYYVNDCDDYKNIFRIPCIVSDCRIVHPKKILHKQNILSH